MFEHNQSSVPQPMSARARDLDDLLLMGQDPFRSQEEEKNQNRPSFQPEPYSNYMTNNNSNNYPNRMSTAYHTNTMMMMTPQVIAPNPYMQ